MAAIVPAGSARMLQARGHRILFSTYDDNVTMKQILSTHSPDDREFHVQPLFRIIEDVMHRTNAPLLGTILSTTLQATQAQLDEKALRSCFSDIIILLAHTIKKISSEITCKCSGGGDAQATTMSLLNTLSVYPWEVKVVVALAAFIMIHEEFCLVEKLDDVNPLAKSVAHLKQLPGIMEQAESWKPKFESLGNLIKAVLDLTNCIVDFKSLPSQYINPDTPEMVIASAHIPIAVYWTIRSIVASASMVINLTSSSHEYIATTTETWEFSSLAHKVNSMHNHLKEELSLCRQHIAIVPTGSARMQQERGDRILFSMSDDNVMMDQILSTHSPDGREFHVQPLFLIIEDAMHRADAPLLGTTLSTTLEGTTAQLDDKFLHNGFPDILKLLALTIKKISCEITCKCSGGGDAQATTVSLFKTLSIYPWDVKVVVALAALVMIHDEFCLVAQLCHTNPLAKSAAHLKQLPDTTEPAESLIPKFESLDKLIKAVLDLTKCIVEFKSLISQYINPDVPEMVSATAHIPIAVYWTIRSIVACAFIVINLIGLSHEYLALITEAWELYSLARKLNNMHAYLNKQLSFCHQHIAMKKHDEAYRTFVRLLETPHFNNTKFLKTLIYPKDDQLPLCEGSTRRRVSIETLRTKIVLLLITEDDMPQEELVLFDLMYRDAKQSQFAESNYEVVWLPIMDKSVPWNEEKQKLLENTQSVMPWLFLYHPSMLDPLAIRYIKDKWHFTKKSIVVVVDQQGKVVNLNALHMMWIWANMAYPFTSLKEEQLWKEESWRIELVVDSIQPMIFDWIIEGKHICLYGGDDIDWIRRFTTTAQVVARAANIHLEMLYVGKSNPTKKIEKIIKLIEAEKLSHVLQDLTLIWYLWSRIESMWHSKVQHGKSVEKDEIMKEIMMMLYFDGSDQGWAVIFEGQKDMAKAKGEMFLKSLYEFDEWKHDSEEKGFLPALNGYFKKLYTPHHCHRFTVPGSTGSVEDKVVCAECGRPMEKSTMYTCCTD